MAQFLVYGAQLIALIVGVATVWTFCAGVYRVAKGHDKWLRCFVWAALLAALFLMGDMWYIITTKYPEMFAGYGVF